MTVTALKWWFSGTGGVVLLALCGLSWRSWREFFHPRRRLLNASLLTAAFALYLQWARVHLPHLQHEILYRIPLTLFVVLWIVVGTERAIRWLAEHVLVWLAERTSMNLKKLNRLPPLVQAWGEPRLDRLIQTCAPYRRIGFFALFGLTLAIGWYLRTVRLGEQGLWLDEAVTTFTSEQSWWNILTTSYAYSPYPASLHPLLLKLLPFTQDSDFMARLPTALFAWATILLIFRAGNFFLNPALGLVSATLLAFSLGHIYFSYEVRPPVLVAFFTLGSLGACWRWLQRPTWKRFGMYALWQAGNVLSHPISILVLMTQGIYLVWHWWRATPALRNRVLVLATSLVGLTWLGAKPTVIAYSEGFAKAIFNPVPISILDTFSALLFSRPMATHNWATAMVFWSYMALGAVGIAGWIKAARHQAVFLLWHLVFPLCFITYVQFHTFHYRYVVFMIPVCLLFIGYGALTMVRHLYRSAQGIFYPRMAAASFFAFGLCTFIIQFRSHGVPIKDHWKQAAQYMRQHYQEGDLIFVEHPWEIIPFSRYARRFNLPLNTVRPGWKRVWLARYSTTPRTFWDWRIKESHHQDGGFIYWYLLVPPSTPRPAPSLAIENHFSNFDYLFSIERTENLSHLNEFLQPLRLDRPGYVIYRVENKKPLSQGSIRLIVQCLYPGDQVHIWAGAHDQALTEIQALKSPAPHGEVRLSANLSSAVRGTRQAFVKIELMINPAYETQAGWVGLHSPSLRSVALDFK